MKQIAVVTSMLLIVAFAAPAAQSYVPPLGDRLWQIKELIQSQIERVKSAREEAENNMTLARLRIAEQLRMSEERLAMQLEKLRQYEEIMKEQLQESGAAIDAARAEWNAFMDSITSDLDSQISKTNQLIEEMRKIRGYVDDESNRAIPQFTIPSSPPSTAPPRNCPQDPVRNLQSLQNLQAELDSISRSISSSEPSSPSVSTPVATVPTGG